MLVHSVLLKEDAKNVFTFTYRWKYIKRVFKLAAKIDTTVRNAALIDIVIVATGV